jgi:hypothetical protein
MAVITFDTHEHIKALISAGLPENQAEAIVNSQKALADSSLVTKADLQVSLEPLKQELSVIKVTLGFMAAGIGAMLLKLYFPH